MGHDSDEIWTGFNAELLKWRKKRLKWDSTNCECSVVGLELETEVFPR